MFCRATEIFVLWTLINFAAFGQDAYREAVSRGLRLQIQSDSLRRVVETQTASLSSTPESGRMSLTISIRDNDALAVALQKQANEQFAKAETMLVKKERDTAKITEAQFAILPKSPYSAANPMPIDEPLPDGLAYKIQLGAFSRTLPANTFRGLTPISCEMLENGTIRYFVGLFRLYSDADDALRKIREYGFKEAFTVAFYNRSSISVDRARQIELTINN